MIMKKHFRILLWAFTLLLLSAGFSWGKVYIDITSPSFRKLPIAIAPFEASLTGSGEMKLGERATDILTHDLNLTGFFALIDPKSSGEKIGQTSPGKSPETEDFRRWANLGAEALILGHVTYQDRSLTLEARLYDVVKKELIVGKRYRGEITDLSRMVHRFADEVVLALTGEPGFFQTKIVYISKAAGGKELFVMDFDGRNVSQLTQHQSICISPRFSPDGTKIAFTSYKAGNPDLYLKYVRGGEERRIANYPGLNITPSWSPDGQRLALTLSKDGNSEIYTMRLDGSGLARLTNHPAIDVSPSWSPDGRRIAFVSDRGGNPQIYVMNADGQNIQRLTFQGSYNTHPSWSPRGDRIAFDASAGGGYNICTIRPDGADYRVLTDNLGRCESPSWSPDGRHLVFSGNSQGGPHIYMINAEGTQIKRLTFQNGGDTNPYWSPRIQD
ncbi:MAG: Tol-Pal system beta propeller repeat protein TolB [Deltaproteobacteria bacterium]|nr:MAG: Tol-Pal system beta propeller repeat protein TolB [Deltaproteobacteria bacterium]